MNKEEAIEGIKRLIKWLNKWNEDYVIVPEDKIYFETVLNLLEKKDKIIDEMAGEIRTKTLMYSDMSKEEVKQYFERKVENGN